MLALTGDSIDNILLSIAERIKERRLERNWTQKAMACKV